MGQKYHELWYEVKPYLDALHRAPELVSRLSGKDFLPHAGVTMNVQTAHNRNAMGRIVNFVFWRDNYLEYNKKKSVNKSGYRMKQSSRLARWFIFPHG